MSSDGPHLIHGNQRVTTDATLKRDLEQSLAQTSSNAPISNAEIRAKLLTIEATLGAISDRIAVLIDGQRTLMDNSISVLKAAHILAQNDSDLGAMVDIVRQDIGLAIGTVFHPPPSDDVASAPAVTGHASASRPGDRPEQPHTLGPVALRDFRHD